MVHANGRDRDESSAGTGAESRERHGRMWDRRDSAHKKQKKNPAISENEMVEEPVTGTRIEALPDDLWNIILHDKTLSYKDVSSFSIANKRANRICTQDSIWEKLEFRDFPYRTAPILLGALSTFLIPEGVPVGVANTGDRPMVDHRVVYKMRFKRIKSLMYALRLMRVAMRRRRTQNYCKELERCFKLEQEKLAKAEKEIAFLKQITETEPTSEDIHLRIEVLDRKAHACRETIRVGREKISCLKVALRFRRNSRR